MNPSVDAVEPAIVFSNLRIDGPSPRTALLKDALARAGAARQELVLAGGTFVTAQPAAESVTALGTLLRGGGVTRLCVLAGAGEQAALEAAQGPLISGLEGIAVSFAASLAGGLRGHTLGGTGTVAVLAGDALDPLGGRALPELLGWSGLRGFVRAWSKQLEMNLALREQDSPEQRLAQALATAAREVSGGKPERGQAALEALLQHSRSGGEAHEGAASLWQALHGQLARAVVAVARQRLGSFATVVVGQSPALFAEGAPAVALCGGDDDSYVTVSDGKVQVHGGKAVTLPAGPAVSAGKAASAAQPAPSSAASTVAAPVAKPAPAPPSAAEPSASAAEPTPASQPAASTEDLASAAPNRASPIGGKETAAPAASTAAAADEEPAPASGATSAEIAAAASTSDGGEDSAGSDAAAGAAPNPAEEGTTASRAEAAGKGKPGKRLRRE